MRSIAVLLFVALMADGAGYNADPMHPAHGSLIPRRLLIPGGPYHGSEVFARGGERWLALLRTRAGAYRTAMVTLRLVPAMDPVGGYDDENKLTARIVKTVEPGDVVFLLKGFAVLAGRPVPSALEGRFPLKDLDVTVRFAGRETVLSIRPNGKVDELPGNEKVAIHQVNLKISDNHYVPLPLVVTDYNRVHILWAGDLDGDNRLDFLFEDSGYNFSSQRLFLSSVAQPGEHLKEVAQFYSTGC